MPDSPSRLAPMEPTGLALSAPRQLTLSYSVGLVAALGLLVVTSGAWAVGALVAVLTLLTGGSLVPLLAIVASGFLIGRGWTTLGQSVRSRLRAPDLSEAEALPEAFHSLSPQLQRLVRHTRTVCAAIEDPELDKPAVIRDVFDWVTAVAEIHGDDRDALTDRGLSAAALRAEVVALHDTDDPRPRAVDLLRRFEHALLDAGGDPFRGTVRRAP